MHGHPADSRLVPLRRHLEEAGHLLRVVIQPSVGWPHCGNMWLRLLPSDRAVTQQILGWFHCGYGPFFQWLPQVTVTQPILGWLHCGVPFSVEVEQDWRSSGRYPADSIAASTVWPSDLRRRSSDWAPGRLHCGDVVGVDIEPQPRCHPAVPGRPHCGSVKITGRPRMVTASSGRISAGSIAA
jgi:hypothetical protein